MEPIPERFGLFFGELQKGFFFFAGERFERTTDRGKRRKRGILLVVLIDGPGLTGALEARQTAQYGPSGGRGLGKFASLTTLHYRV